MSDTIDNPDQEYQRAWRQARRQVRRMRGWYLHAFIFCAVVGFAWLRFLFAGSFESLNLFHHAPRLPLGMTLGWGFAVLIHGLVVFGRFGPLGQGWEDRHMKRLLERQSESGSQGGKNS